MLRDIDENGGLREMDDIDYRERFDVKWNEFTRWEQQAINTEIKRQLDALIDAPDPRWGSIMNTSRVGGADNPITGEPGDWSGTPWGPIWNAMARVPSLPRCSSARSGNFASLSAPSCGLEFELQTKTLRSQIEASIWLAKHTFFLKLYSGR